MICFKLEKYLAILCGSMMRILKLLIAPLALLIFVCSLEGQTAKEPFVAADFQVPELYVSRQGTFKLKPLGPKYARQDYAAYMGSIEHLQKTFTFSTSWKVVFTIINLTCWTAIRRFLPKFV